MVGVLIRPLDKKLFDIVIFGFFAIFAIFIYNPGLSENSKKSTISHFATQIVIYLNSSSQLSPFIHTVIEGQREVNRQDKYSKSQNNLYLSPQ